MIALRRLLLLLITAGVAGAWLRRRLEPPSPELPFSGPGPLELPLEEELALVDAAEPTAAAAEDDEEAGDELARVEATDPDAVDIVSVVDDLLEPPR